MTLDQLNMFIAVVEAETFSAAAKKLFISQPSISVAIKNLEAELAIALFDRGHYRPRLTADGQEIYRKAKQIVSLEKELKVSAGLLAKGEESSLAIVLDIVAPLPHILNLIRTYFTGNVACRLELSFCVLGSGLSDIQEGDADLYIGPVFKETDSLDARFHSHYYMIPVLSKHHALGKMPLKDIARNIEESPRVILRDGGPQQKGEAGDRMREEQAIFVEDYLIKKETIVAGLGWGRLPLWNIENELKDGTLIDLREIFPSLKIKGDILVVPKKKNQGKHLTALLGMLSTSQPQN